MSPKAFNPSSQRVPKQTTRPRPTRFPRDRPICVLLDSSYFWCHPTDPSVLGPVLLGSSRAKFSAAISKQSRDSRVLMGFPWKMTSFWCFQSARKAILMLMAWISYASQLVLTHSQTPVEKVAGFDLGIISSSQYLLVATHFLCTWSKSSGGLVTRSTFSTPRLRKWALVNTRLWQRSEMKNTLLTMKYVHIWTVDGLGVSFAMCRLHHCWLKLKIRNS